MNLIIGRKPVLEAILSEAKIERIYILHGTHGNIIDLIKEKANRKNIKISEVDSKKFTAFASTEKSQGVAAVRSELEFFSLEEIIELSKSKVNPLILILDSIQDPQNLGAILRTAECAGVEGIITTVHHSAPINQTVIKTSVGAVEYLKIAKVFNLGSAIKLLKENNFWIVGSSLEGAKDYSEIEYSGPIALIMGNEEKGIRKLTAELCDFLVKIPMSGKIQSLNVSVSTGIILFEINRQKSIKS